MARDLTAEIEAIIGLDDPIGIGGPDNVGEYLQEAKEIMAELPALESAQELQRAIHDIFGWMFSPEMAGSLERYDSMARQIWALTREDR
ncbi:hypothetical protein [Leifsonia sp. AG29]|uniref:hypothetical protein n=1 Tax=Leifsonia sp. AG29 TaxID=2598860 RepID=UPI00131AC04F|nr:hypothetical protein [Leifsonia sp. AG29]